MNLLYELWLHDVCGFEPKKVSKFIFVFQNAYNAFHSKPYSLSRIKACGMSGILSVPKDLSTAERIIKDCKEKDIRIITIHDEDYPSLLREIYLPPRILFVKGSLKNFDDYFPIAIVGTRKATDQGKIFTERLSKKLCDGNKVLVVSGMADGIDAQAHRGALAGGSKTVAVLAGGVDKIYPLSNKSLYYEILKNGAIVSERPPGTVGQSYHYKQRNRIIAGLSRGVVVVEGQRKTGTRYTVDHADENNRDVFTVPSNPVLPQSQFPNELIKRGAHIVLNERDIIDEYINVYPEYFNIKENTDKQESKSKLPGNLTEEEQLIIDFIIKKGGEAHADEMAAEINVPIGKLNGTLTLLSLKGILSQSSQNQYLLKEVEYFAN